MWHCPTCNYAFKWGQQLGYHIQEMHVGKLPLDNKVPPVYGSVGRKRRIRRIYAV